MKQPNSVEIPLTQGKVTLVDVDDLPLIVGYKWFVQRSPYDTYYAKSSTGGKMVLLHRLISGATKGLVVDHINHDTLDNRRHNLRVCLIVDNSRNKKPYSGLKYKGITKKPRGWHAQICVSGAKRGLGTYDIEEDAARAYDKAALEAFGEFAYLNFPIAA